MRTVNVSLHEDVYEQLVGRQQELREESGTKISLSEVAARLITGGLDRDAPLGQASTKEKPSFSIKLLEMREKALLEKAEQITKWEADVHDMANRVFQEKKRLAEEADEYSPETFNLIMAQRDAYEAKYLEIVKETSTLKAELRARERELEHKTEEMESRLADKEQEHRIGELEEALRDIVKMHGEQEKKLKKSLLKKDDVLQELVREIKQQREFNYKDLIVPLSLVLGPSLKAFLEELFAKANGAKAEEKTLVDGQKGKTE